MIEKLDNNIVKCMRLNNKIIIFLFFFNNNERNMRNVLNKVSTERIADNNTLVSFERRGFANILSDTSLYNVRETAATISVRVAYVSEFCWNLSFTA